jgi:hypothetical protein
VEFKVEIFFSMGSDKPNLELGILELGPSLPSTSRAVEHTDGDYVYIGIYICLGFAAQGLGAEPTNYRCSAQGAPDLTWRFRK